MAERLSFDRIADGLREATVIARGDRPAPRLHVRGHAYVPEAEYVHLRSELARLVEERAALITLLYTDETFIGTHRDGPIREGTPTRPVLCAHVANYGADAEEIPEDAIVPLARLVDRFGNDAVQAWVCHVRGLDDMVKGRLSESGRQALEFLRGGIVAATIKEDAACATSPHPQEASGLSVTSGEMIAILSSARKSIEGAGEDPALVTEIDAIVGRLGGRR